MPNFSLPGQVFLAAAQQYQTPFHLYDEAAIRRTARRLKAAFAGVPEFREYFAVKALPTPAILRILKDEGCGVDCASMTELMLVRACGFQGRDIMFSANDVPPEEFRLTRPTWPPCGITAAFPKKSACAIIRATRLPWRARSWVSPRKPSTA